MAREERLNAPGIHKTTSRRRPWKTLRSEWNDEVHRLGNSVNISETGSRWLSNTLTLKIQFIGLTAPAMFQGL